MDKTGGRRRGGVVLGIGAVLLLAAAPAVTAHETMGENTDGSVVLADDWAMSEVEDVLSDDAEDGIDGATDATQAPDVAGSQTPRASHDASSDEDATETQDAQDATDDTDGQGAEQDDSNGQGSDQSDDSGADSSGGGGDHADD